MVKKWTEEEIEFLKQHYPPKKEGPQFVAEKLGRSYTAVMTRARKLNIKSKKHSRWEPWMIDYLKEYYGYMSVKALQLKLHKSYSAILEKVQVYHLSRRQSDPFSKDELEKLEVLYPDKKNTQKKLERVFNRPWDYIRKTANSMGLFREHQMTRDEEIFIRRNYKKKKIREMAADLGVNYGVIKWYMKQKNLKKDNRRSWSKEELNYVINNYGTLSLDQMGFVLNRTKRAIQHIVEDYKLSKDTPKQWTRQEVDFILKNYTQMTASQMSAFIPRSKNSIYVKLNDLFKNEPEKLALRKLSFIRKKKC